MLQANDIQQPSDDRRFAELLAAWPVEHPGEGFFATLPAIVQSRFHDRPVSAIRNPGVALSGLTAVLAIAVVVLAAGSIQRQQAFSDRLISEAASWSAEQASGITDLADDDVSDQQNSAGDGSLGAAVERVTIEHKAGYQLLDDLSNDEIKQVVSTLTTTRG